MKQFSGYVKDYILYYAKELEFDKVPEIISKGVISSEEEAKVLLKFIDVMYDKSIEDTELKKVFLGNQASTYDADKAAILIHNFIEFCGFGNLLDDDSLDSE